MKSISSYFVFLLIFSITSFAKMTQESVYVFDSHKNHIKLFKSHKDLSIDHVSSKGYELYGPTGLIEWLDELGIDYMQNDNEYTYKNAFTYPSPEDIENELKELALEFPKILKLFSIGESVQGRKLWTVKISDNVHDDEIEPEFKYIANMHGDEIVGRELMVRLIRDLATSYENGNQSIVKLINNTEIFITPSMNPDGADRKMRGNSNYVDLNRDFPDFTNGDDVNSPNGRAPETAAVMRFQAKRHFALSANFHGGTEVVNYPWDTTHQEFPMHNLIVALSKEYADDVSGMRNSSEFPGGIVNGYDWYEVDGGMQDWSFKWHEDLQVTVELSHRKWPHYSTIHGYYIGNRKSMLTYIERIHQGAGVYFANKNEKGKIKIYKLLSNGSKSLISTSRFEGEFYKVLENGRYQFNVTKESGNMTTMIVSVNNQQLSNYKKL
jgi:hypothetical protein